MTKWLFFHSLLWGLFLPFTSTAQQPAEAVLVIDPEDAAYREGLYYFPVPKTTWLVSVCDATRAVKFLYKFSFCTIFRKQPK